MNWIIGFLVSVVAGHIVVVVVHHFTYKHIDVVKLPGPGVPAWIVGVVERAFFTMVVAFELSGAAVAMMAWIALKMAAGWNWPDLRGEGETREGHARGALGAVFVGLLSMGFAIVGGLICNGDIPIPWAAK